MAKHKNKGPEHCSGPLSINQPINTCQHKRVSKENLFSFSIADIINSCIKVDLDYKGSLREFLRLA